MKLLKYVYYFAIFLALHLVFWMFTGMTLWAPMPPGMSFREFVLLLTHVGVFFGAAIYLSERDE